MDSYNPDLGEIVSRKYTQLAEINEETAIKYLKELKEKYPEGAAIAEVPSSISGANKGILKYGDDLKGQMILEVPVQSKPVPQKVLEYADKNDIIIRDISNRTYSLK